MIKIAEVMSTEVHTLNPDDTLSQARSLMMDKHIRHIPVIDEDRKLVGLLTHRDLLAAADSALSAEGEDQRSKRERSTPVSRVMTMQLNSVDENASLRGAALHLQKYKHGCLPVLREGRLVGIITDSDYVGVAINLLEQLEQIDPLESDTVEMEL
jgi:CBS domain-containing protein